jgi:hypothetical protein
MNDFRAKLQTESNTWLGFMVGQGLKRNAISSMKLLILLIGWTMNKLLALIARAKLILLTEEIRQGLKK